MLKVLSSVETTAVLVEVKGQLSAFSDFSRIFIARTWKNK